MSAPTPITAPPTPTTESASIAEKILDKVLPLSEHHYNKGVDYFGGGQYQISIQEFTEAIQLDPDDADAYAGLGNTYDDLGQHQQAILDLNMAIQLDPDDAWAHYIRAVVYRNLGQYLLANADDAKACSLDSQYC